MWNSLGVIALGIMEGLQPAVLQEGLASFPGVKRRFTIEEKNGNVYIDAVSYTHLDVYKRQIKMLAKSKEIMQ